MNGHNIHAIRRLFIKIRLVMRVAQPSFGKERFALTTRPMEAYAVYQALRFLFLASTAIPFRFLYRLLRPATSGITDAFYSLKTEQS